MKKKAGQLVGYLAIAVGIRTGWRVAQTRHELFQVVTLSVLVLGSWQGHMHVGYQMEVEYWRSERPEMV